MRAAALAVFLASLAAAEAPLPERDAPPPGRAGLEIPDDAWARAVAGTVPSRAPLGYTGDEMRHYGGRDFILRPVENLFRDVRLIPRVTGRLTDDMLAMARAANPGDLAQLCWALTDMPSGRMYAPPEGDKWGLPDVADGTKPAAVLAKLFPDAGEGFAKFPEPLQRFFLRLAIARRVALPWLSQSVDDRDGAAVRRSLAAPWTDGENDQSATLDGRCFRWLRDVDRAPIAYGSVVFLCHLRVALAELKAWLAAGGDAELAKIGALDWKGLPGLRVLGTSDDAIAGEQPPMVVDLGGNDAWKGRLAAATGPGEPLSVVIDLSGNDTYDSGGESFAFGCGVFGLGALFDLGGDDSYTVQESGLGCAWFGTGVLWDASGKDSYVVKNQWGQGAAHVGAGILVDLAGDDRYECAQQSQGLGSTLGVGLLLDLEGNDAYICRDDGNVSALYLNQSVAMAQGCGYGRRADIGDGRSLAGGWGFLVDGAGDDRYHAQCWSQGCGYWWAIGVLEDRAGNDVYENGKYSSGAGAHYAIGVQVDLAGNDRYNAGITTTKNQFQGHARDASVGISIDGDGDDEYHFKNLCAGSADLCSVALFWDRRGNDAYHARMDKDLGDAAPFGSATVYPPSRSFRDSLPAVGIFLDTGGADTYDGDPRGTAGARDGASWSENRNPMSFGFGMDAGLYK